MRYKCPKCGDVVSSGKKCKHCKVKYEELMTTLRGVSPGQFFKYKKTVYILLTRYKYIDSQYLFVEIDTHKVTAEEAGKMKVEILLINKITFDTKDTVEKKK